MENFKEYIEILAQISIPGSVAIVFYILWRSEVLKSIALRIGLSNAKIENTWNDGNNKTNSKNNIANESRIQALESFQLTQETNHNHDLESLLDWRPKIEARFDKIEERQDKVSDDLNFIKGKLNGQLK